MNMAITFDTLDYARKLESAGVPMAQAELQSRFLAEVFEKSVAAPSDLTSMDRSLNTKIDSVELKLGGKIDKLEMGLNGQIGLVGGEVNLVKWMLGTLLAINIAVALKSFLH